MTGDRIDMKQLKIFKVLFAVFFLLSVFSGQALAQPGSTANCFQCHSDVSGLTLHTEHDITPSISWGTYYNTVTTTGSPTTLTVNAGDSFEVEYIFNGMTTGGTAALKNDGVRVVIAAQTNCRSLL